VKPRVVTEITLLDSVYGHRTFRLVKLGGLRRRFEVHVAHKRDRSTGREARNLTGYFFWRHAGQRALRDAVNFHQDRERGRNGVERERRAE
jgi:hypothetical protein